MRLLLDTHILLWALGNDRQLPAKGAAMIRDPINDVFVSAVSIWEIAIKQSIGRITISQSELVDAISKSGFKQMPVTFEHCAILAELPMVHRDPFDRMLIAQSMTEPAMLLTHDKVLKGYGDSVLVV